jgi:P-type Mg2+ transporter
MIHRLSSSRPGTSVGLPKGIFAALRRQPPPIRVAPILLESASLAADVVYQRLRTRASGLTTDEAEARLSEHGPNMVAADGRKSIGLLVWHAVINPLVLLLAVLATISLSTGDTRAGIVMSLMIVLGVGLRLIQERRADTTAS